MSAIPAVGELAPDFTLPGTVPGDGPGAGERDFTLSQARGRPVVLAFYPADETAVCIRQLCSYQHDLDTLRDLDAELWGVSSQGLDSHRKFQAKRGLTFPLLSDHDSEVFAAYGLGSVLNRRAVFVIDAEGRVAWRHVSKTGLSFRTTHEIAAALRALPAPTTAYPSDAELANETQVAADAPAPRLPLTAEDVDRGSITRLRGGGRKPAVD